MLDEAVAAASDLRRAVRRKRRRTRRGGPRTGDARARADLRSRGRAGSYASLWFSTDTADPVRGALLQRVQERGHRSRDQAAVLRARVGGGRRRARRRAARRTGRRRARSAGVLPSLPAQRPALPAPPADRARGEGPGGEVDLRQQRLGSPVRRARVRRCGSASTTSRCRSMSRSAACSSLIVRHARLAAEAVTGALEPGLRTRAFIYNTLVYDKSVDDRLRHYPHWLASRNLANEASDESVMALIEAVRNRYDIPRRWYTLKAQADGPAEARRLRPDGARGPGRDPRSRSARLATWCSTPTSRSRPRPAG